MWCLWFSIGSICKAEREKAIHLAGALQLLFGIRGKRWEDPNYNSTYNYSALMNQYWVKPQITERSQNAERVEGACYW